MIPFWICDTHTALTLATADSQSVEEKIISNAITIAGPGPTSVLAQWIAGARPVPEDSPAWTWARHALLDWAACAVAGAGEPLSVMLRDEYAMRGAAHGSCTLIGGGCYAQPLEAALVNGTAGHALDYDDVSSRMVGHPTAPLAPAVLVDAQARGASGRELLEAFIVGYEAQAWIGEWLGASHYKQGFHTTGTLGTFGAAAGCARLRGLSANQVRHALGLAAAQAAGLKSMFGTMAKPLQAGKAAMNGLLAVQLAERGFTANPSALEVAQGFADTQVPAPGRLRTDVETSGGFAVERTLFKFHAACYLTHATLEAIRTLKADIGVGLSQLDRLRIQVAGSHSGVCDIGEPRSGLELKFSIRHLAAMALDGADTAALHTFNDAAACDPRYVQARERIALEVSAPSAEAANVARVVLCTKDGREFTATADVGSPATDLNVQWQRLTAKARGIAAPLIGEERFARLLEAIDRLPAADTINPLMETIA